MWIFLKILDSLSRKGKIIWTASVALSVFASILEVASAATFSLLTSSLFGGRKSNFGILEKSLPFIITQTVLISILGVIFIGKLGIQWVELNLKTRSAEEFFISIFQRKASQSQEEIERSESPVTNLANRMHVLTHNVYYPAGLIISELLILVFLIPFVIYISPKASLLVFGATLVLSIPALGMVRKRITKLHVERIKIDSSVDYITYSNFRTFHDQGFFPLNKKKLTEQIHVASEIDRKIVKLGSYSRLTIEFSFIVSVILTFSLIDKLVAAEARIQFFAVLAYSFFRVIPAFSRIIAARNQIASHQSEFMNLMQTDLASIWGQDSAAHTTFKSSLVFKFQSKNSEALNRELRFSVGASVVIKGETGIGKTTLLKSVGGLIHGEFNVVIDGQGLADPNTWRPSSALVSQNPFLSGATLLDMVTGQESREGIDVALFEEALQLSCLSNWTQGRPNVISNEHISGGERKQIALARAIYLRPEILLLDEVTAGMDHELAKKILSNLLTSSRFKLILMATHDSILDSQFSQIIYL